MITCLGKKCSFGLLYLSFVCVCASFPFGFEGRMWDLIVFVPDYYFPFYFTCCPCGKMSFAQSCRSMVRKYS